MDDSSSDPRGQLVRPYSVTRGRTTPTSDIAIESLLGATARGSQEAPFAGRDKQLITQLCTQGPQSLAEVAAHLQMPLGVARVLVADMVNDQMLTLHTQSGPEESHERIQLLEQVLEGLRRL